jgi:hypothetical protein
MHVKKTVVFLLNSAALIALANSPVVYAQAAGSGGTGGGDYHRDSSRQCRRLLWLAAG